MFGCDFCGVIVIVYLVLKGYVGGYFWRKLVVIIFEEFFFIKDLSILGNCILVIEVDSRFLDFNDF